MTIEVRAAEPEDAHGLAAVHVRAWQVAYRGIVPDQHLDGLDLVERTEHWASILRAEHCADGVDPACNLVALSGQEVVGFAAVGPWRDEQLDPALGELWALYAHPDRWATGVGDALMEASLAELERRGHERCALWVFAENPRARRFYERHGWVDDGVEDQFEIAGATIAEVRYSRVLTR